MVWYLSFMSLALDSLQVAFNIIWILNQLILKLTIS